MCIKAYWVQKHFKSLFIFHNVHYKKPSIRLIILFINKNYKKNINESLTGPKLRLKYAMRQAQVNIKV